MKTLFSVRRLIVLLAGVAVAAVGTSIGIAMNGGGDVVDVRVDEHGRDDD